MNKTFYFKIVLILIISFIITGFFKNNVFIANTPKINSNFPKNLIAKTESLFFKTKNLLANLFINKKESELAGLKIPSQFQKTYNEMEKIPFKLVANGVYAKAKDNLIVTEIRINEVEWVEYSLNINGKQVRIKVPKGESPPPQTAVEKLYGN